MKNQNFVAALAYLGGAITGVVVLAVEKQNRFVRFHAMQSTVTFVLVLVAQLLLRNVPVVGGVAVVAVGVGVVFLGMWLFVLGLVSGEIRRWVVTHELGS